MRCFIEGGLTNKEGEKMDFPIELEDLQVKEGDMVIYNCLTEYEQITQKMEEKLEELKQKNCKIFRFLVSDEKKIPPKKNLFDNDFFFQISKSNHQNLTNFLFQFASKLVFNAITTCAHVLKGKVYENYMIDVGVSNNKLYFRSINIVSKFSNVDLKISESLILKSIYSTDQLTENILSKKISERKKKKKKKIL